MSHSKITVQFSKLSFSVYNFNINYINRYDYDMIKGTI